MTYIMRLPYHCVRHQKNLWKECLSPSCRAKSSSCTTPFLKKWHNLVSKVPKLEIVPHAFGGIAPGTAVNEAAWYGDKLIGEQVALQLYNFSLSSNEQKNKNVCSALRAIYTLAVSNQLFADEVKAILPLHVTKKIEGLAKVKVHDAGTMVEAAVSAVSSLPKVARHEPTAALARYLIFRAEHQLKILPSDVHTKLQTLLMNVNVLGGATVAAEDDSTSCKPFIGTISADQALRELNKYGGTVDCTEAASRQARPMFRATATLNGTYVSSEAHRKKIAKRQAAYNLLVQLQAKQQKQIS